MTRHQREQPVNDLKTNIEKGRAKDFRWPILFSTLELCFRLILMGKKILPRVLVTEIPNTTPRMRKFGSKGMSVIVLHGLTREGFDDQRLIDFSKVLAACGFQVYTPDLYGLRDLKLDFVDVKLIVESIKTVSKDQKDVGVIGFSVGGTYGLIASSMEDVRKHVLFVFAAGAYWSLTNLFEYSFNSKHEDPYVMLAMDWQVIDRLGLSDEDKEMYKKLMDHYCERCCGFNVEEKRLMEKLINNAHQPEILDWWKGQLQMLKGLDLDGNDYLDRLEGEIFLLHSQNDELIPPSETEAIFNYLQKTGKPVHCCFSGNPSHLDYTKGEITGLFGLCYRLMRLIGDER